MLLAHKSYNQSGRDTKHVKCVMQCSANLQSLQQQLARLETERQDLLYNAEAMRRRQLSSHAGAHLGELQARNPVDVPCIGADPRRWTVLRTVEQPGKSQLLRTDQRLQLLTDSVMFVTLGGPRTITCKFVSSRREENSTPLR